MTEENQNQTQTEQVTETQVVTETKTETPALTLTSAPSDITGSMYESPAAFEHIQRIAKVFATADIVPKAYQGKLANCIVGLQVAYRLNLDPFLFFQNSAVVNGKPSLDGKLCIALLNSRAPIKDYARFDYSGQGDTRKCTCWVIHADTGERLEYSMTIAEVKDWGWWDQGLKIWRKMPDQMLAYRTASYLMNRYFPNLKLGLSTTEELQDMQLSRGDDFNERANKMIEPEVVK